MSSSVGSLGYHRLTLEKIPVRSGHPVRWGDLVADWERYVADKTGKFLVFTGREGTPKEGEMTWCPYAHRFKQEYTRMQYAKIQGFIRGALSEYDDPHLAILTFSTSTTTPQGDPRPPLDHLDEVTGTWGDGVYYELNQVMGGKRKRDPWTPRSDWEYLYILEPTTNRGVVPGGYAHAHVGIVVDGAVDERRFQSVMDRHITEAPNATGDAHELEDAVVVKRAAELGNPGAYLFKYLGKSWDVDDQEDYERRFNALLHADGGQRFRASNDAQRWMQIDEESTETGQWNFAGVAESEQIKKLAEYDDLEDFLIATNADGLRSWVNQTRVSTAAWEIEEEIERREKNQKRVLTEEQYAGRVDRGWLMPWEYEALSDTDRPPPVVGE